MTVIGGCNDEGDTVDGDGVDAYDDNEDWCICLTVTEISVPLLIRLILMMTTVSVLR